MATDNNTYSLHDLEHRLKQDIDDQTTDIKANEYPDDYLHEIVDGFVPVYNADLLRYALDDLWLAVVQPEHMAFDGENTAVNAIAANIYDHLMECANEYWRKLTEEAA